MQSNRFYPPCNMNSTYHEHLDLLLQKAVPHAYAWVACGRCPRLIGFQNAVTGRANMDVRPGRLAGNEVAEGVIRDLIRLEVFPQPFAFGAVWEERYVD